MKTRIGRLCTLTLISLLSLVGFAAQGGAQAQTVSRLGGPPKMRAKTEKTHKASILGGAASNYQVLYSFCSDPNCTEGKPLTPA